MSKWSSYKSDQLLMENWRVFISEERVGLAKAGTLGKTYDPDLYRDTTVYQGAAEDEEALAPPGSTPPAGCSPREFTTQLLGYVVGAGLKPLMQPVEVAIDGAIASGALATRHPVFMGIAAINTALGVIPGVDSVGDQVTDIVSSLLTRAISAIVLPDESEAYLYLTTFVGYDRVERFCDSWTDLGEIYELYQMLQPEEIARGLNRLVKAGLIFEGASDLRNVKYDVPGIAPGVFWFGALVADTLMPGEAHPITDYLGFGILGPPDPVYSETLEE
jgi:hypothetical protein